MSSGKIVYLLSLAVLVGGVVTATVAAHPPESQASACTAGAFPAHVQDGNAPGVAGLDIAPAAAPAGQGWFAGTSAPTARYRTAGVEDPAGCALYAIGGLVDQTGQMANERYDPNTDSWVSLAPKPHGSGNAQAALLDGRIYVVGGYDRKNYQDWLDIYDIASNTWAGGATLPQAVSGAAVESDGIYVYAFGGEYEGSEFSTVYRYDPGMDTWELAAPMPAATAYATAETMNGTIYVCGGWLAETSCFAYDPIGDAWTAIAAMNAGRQSLGLEAGSDGCLYAFGGGSGWTSLNSVEQWCGGAWVLLDQTMPTGRIGMATGFLQSAQDNGQGALYGATGWAGGEPLAANEYLEREFANPCAKPCTRRFFDDFESGMGHWTTTGLWNEEHEADACGSQVAPFPSPSTAAYYGLDGVCTYDTGDQTHGSLEMVADVDLRHTFAATLTYWSYEETECGGSCARDDRLVQVSTDGGTTWTTLGQGDTENTWYQASFDLTPYVGGPLRIRFRFDSQDASDNSYMGWMVDDVEIDGCANLALTPAELEVEGCAGVVESHAFELYNHTGAGDTFDLVYEVPTGNGFLDGPGSLFVPHGVGATLVADLAPDDCLPEGTQVVGRIYAQDSTGTYAARSVITKTILLGGWTEETPMLTPRADHAVVASGGRLYAIGGTTAGVPPGSGENERYELLSGTWTVRTPMPSPMTFIDGDEIDGIIYIPGGDSGSGYLTTVEAYDLVANSWATVAAAPRAVAAYGVAACDGLLYRVGGGYHVDWPRGDTGAEVYSPVTDNWTVLAPMHHGHTWPAVGCIDGKLYVAGGLDGSGNDTAVAEVYDVATNTWSDAAMADLPQTWWGSADVVQDGRLYLAGGVANGGVSARTISYDPAADAWDEGPPLNQARFRLSGAFAGDSGYAQGGWQPVGVAHGSNERMLQCPTCQGFLDGFVTDDEMEGSCPPCTAAGVHIEPGGLDISTDETGYYWTSLFPGTYQVEATAPGYASDGVHDVQVTQDMTVTQDLGLWRPVAEVTPTGAISVTALVSDEISYPLVIRNLGHQALEFEIVERSVGTAAASLGFKSVWLDYDVKIDPQVVSELEAKGATDVFVQMRNQADLGPAFHIADWSLRGDYVYHSLLAATMGQEPVIAHAKQRGLEVETRLGINAVFVKGVTAWDVEALAALPAVRTIRANRLHRLDHAQRAPAPEAWGWNLDELNPDAGKYGMQAAQVWQDLGILGDCDGCGYAGKDHIVVANIDTGVFYPHEALVHQYRGNLGGGVFSHDYNWFLPTTGCPDPATPCDNHGHGSGTMGIMVGETADLAQQIGVAPYAQWIACKGCEGDTCSDAALTACADWIIAPWRLDGSDPEPAMRPHIVNNSWGDTGCDDWYDAYIQAWRAAGIFPAFSAGNTQACGKVGSPGDSPYAFSSAAHASDGRNLYAGGPSCWFPNPSCDPHAHQVDPHVNAPSFGRTAGNCAGCYVNLGGTSGASPHTAGCVALMWAANPALIGDIDTTFTLLEQTADRSSTQPWNAGNCVKPACAVSDPYPNYEYGWGYLDCYAAVDGALHVGPTDLSWVWTDPVSGTVPPLDEVTVGVTMHCSDATDEEGSLRILHTDPCTVPFDVPLVLRCEECVEVQGVALSMTTAGPIYPGDLVAFDADIVPNTADKPYTYGIDFGDGTSPVAGSSIDDPLAFSHSYTSPGTYPVEIAVSNCGMLAPVVDTVDVGVEVTCVEVQGVALSVTTPGPIYPGDGVAFQADIVPSTADKPYTYGIDFGDGTSPVAGSSIGDPLAFSHSYTATGTYSATIAVSNCDMLAPVVDTVAVTVAAAFYPLYLPLVVKANSP